MDKYLFFRSNISFIHVIRLLTVAHFHHTKKMHSHPFDHCEKINSNCINYSCTENNKIFDLMKMKYFSLLLWLKSDSIEVRMRISKTFQLKNKIGRAMKWNGMEQDGTVLYFFTQTAFRWRAQKRNWTLCRFNASTIEGCNCAREAKKPAFSEYEMNEINLVPKYRSRLKCNVARIVAFARSS